jgi:hypothetical protein
VSKAIEGFSPQDNWVALSAMDPRGAEFGRMDIYQSPKGDVYVKHSLDDYEIHFINGKHFQAWATSQGLQVRYGIKASKAPSQDTQDLREIVCALREWFSHGHSIVGSAEWGNTGVTWNAHLESILHRLGGDK